MTPNSCDYETRRGIRPILWSDFHGLVKARQGIAAGPSRRIPATPFVAAKGPASPV